MAKVDPESNRRRKFQSEIDVELLALREFRSKSGLHPKLKDRIDSQIQVLFYELTIEQILRQHADDEDAQGAAEDALGWVEGWEMPAPSDLLAEAQNYYSRPEKSA